MNRFQSLPGNIRQIVVIALAGWFIFNLFQSFNYVLADYPQVPVADYWRIPQLWADPHTIRWSNLWVQHNEHRIVFPELIYIFDMLLLRGRMYLPIAVSGFCYLSVWGVLAWTVYSEESIATQSLSRQISSLQIRQIVLLLAGILMVWKGCSTVIATPFQLSFTLLHLVSIFAFAFIWKVAESGRSKYLAAAILAAVVCTYSTANGMLLWPVLIATAIFLKIARSQILILTIAAVAFVAVFFFQYHFLPSAISTNIRHPLAVFAFVCSYLSMPFSAHQLPVFGFVVGGIHLLLIAVCGILAARWRLLYTRLGTVLFGTYLFTFASVLLTAAGRMDLNDTLFDQAKAWRYLTVPTIAWALLTIAVLWIVFIAASANLATLSAVLIAGLFYDGLRHSSEWVEGTRLDAENGQILATMLRNGVFDPNQVRTIFPDPEFVRVFNKVLQDNHKMIYAHGADKWIGSSTRSLTFDTTPTAGKIARVVPVPGGLEIFGWASSMSLTDDHEILFVDNQERIAGFGRRPGAGMPFSLSAWDTPNPLTFVGYVSSFKVIGPLLAYVQTRHGKTLQPIDQIIDIPSYTQLATKSDNPLLSDIRWVPEQNWKIGGYTVEPQNGPAPPGDIYASWSGSDTNTGNISTKPFDTPPNYCMVLPVLHGTATYGQSVAIIDAATRRNIAQLSLLDGRSIWERWRIPIPQTTRQVVIQAADQGTGPHQWLALATPQHCPASQ